MESVKDDKNKRYKSSDWVGRFSALVLEVLDEIRREREVMKQEVGNEG